MWLSVMHRNQYVTVPVMIVKYWTYYAPPPPFIYPDMNCQQCMTCSTKTGLRIQTKAKCNTSAANSLLDSASNM